MTKTKDELIAMAKKYDDKASKAYYNYQETGTQRYHREMENAEDMADALRMAASAEEDHNKLLNLRAELQNLAYKCDLMLEQYGPDMDHTPALKQIISLAEVFCGYRRKEKV